MNDIKGYLIECQGRSLFLRDKADISWAYTDPEYTVVELVANTGSESHLPPDFQGYVEVSEKLYKLQEEQIEQGKVMLEQAIELIESIAVLSGKKTENMLESKGLLLLISEDCKKFLKSSDE